MKWIAQLQQLAVLGILSSVVAATPNPIPGSDNVTLRDPAIWYNKDLKKYFVFSTGDNINISTSTSLTGPWTSIGSALPNCSKINLPGNCSIWAPDVNFIDGLYTMYYSVSTGGSQNSSIGVATSPTMNPGNWTDLGEVIRSASGHNESYNAIDGNIFNDNGTLRLSFGSYQQGMFQIGIGPGLTNHTQLPGIKIAGHQSRPAEGGFLYKPSSQPYYYFFFSDGITPLIGNKRRPLPNKEYKVIMGRGKDVQGPFYDESGNDLTLNTTVGTILLKSHDNVYAPGGQSIFADPVSGRDVIVYHYVKKNDPPGGPSYLGINYLDFSSGWPVIAD
ncbi:glycoside hydrolase family 43 protein [Collybiopsis luxurians FD-317 M1]|nr:glycoside hydrolase family 43 protein [Collybiopsis luxurians FD-317 M1]